MQLLGLRCARVKSPKNKPLMMMIMAMLLLLLLLLLLLHCTRHPSPPPPPLHNPNDNLPTVKRY